MATTKKTASTSKTTAPAERSTKTEATKAAPGKKPVNVEKVLKEAKDTKTPGCDCNCDSGCENCSGAESTPTNIVPWSRFVEELKELCGNEGVVISGNLNINLLKNIVALSKRYDLVDRKGQVSSNKAFNMITAMLDGQGRAIEKLQNDIEAIRLNINVQGTVVNKIAADMTKGELHSATLESSNTFRIRKKDIRKIRRVVREETTRLFRRVFPGRPI